MLMRRTAALGLALGTLAILLGVLGIDLYRRVGEIREEALARGRARSIEIASSVGQSAWQVENVAQRLAGLDPVGLKPPQLRQTIEEATLSHKAVRGVTIAFERDSYPHHPGLYAPYYNGPEGRFIECHELYSDESGIPYDDREDEYHDWFWRPIEQGKALWSSVNYGQAAGAQVVNYSVPFRASLDGRYLGVATATMSVQEGLNQLLKALLPRGASYGFIVNRDGRFLAHPSIGFVERGRSIRKMTEEVGDPRFEHAVDAMLRGESGDTAFLSAATGRDAVLFYRPIPAGDGWALGLVFPASELFFEERALHRTRLTLTLTAILFASTAIALGTRTYRLRERDWTRIAALVSSACLLGIGSTWWLALDRPVDLTGRGGAIIGDRASLDRFLNEINGAGAGSSPGDQHRIVDTGFWVSGLEFENAHNVQARGVIWQRPGLEDGEIPDRPPFVFPDAAPDAEAVTIEPEYRADRPGGAVVGWSFAATLRPELSFRTYPFDRHVLRIRIRPRELDEPVVLAPDLRSYERLDPGSMPGLRRQDLLPGWRIEGTYFEYRPREAGTGFGLGRSDRLVELCYCIVLRRGILSPILTHLVPIAFVLLLLYGVLVSSTKIEGRCTIAGFNTFGVLEIAAALLFVICLAQIDLRNSLMAEEITYLEYFYFITYAIILLVALDSIIFTTTDSVRWIEYKDNLAAKLLYWPIFLGLCLAATVYAFA